MPTLVKPDSERKRPAPRPIDPHAFESIGSILRRMRMEAEAQMTETFDHPLSMKLDFLVAAEQREEEGGDD